MRKKTDPKQKGMTLRRRHAVIVKKHLGYLLPDEEVPSDPTWEGGFQDGRSPADYRADSLANGFSLGAGDFVEEPPEDIRL